MRCPRCSHEASFDGDAANEIVTCGECSARIAFGCLVPAVTIQPTRDSRFIEMQIDGHVVGRFDRLYAWRIAYELLSILPPNPTP